MTDFKFDILSRLYHYEGSEPMLETTFLNNYAEGRSEYGDINLAKRNLLDLVKLKYVIRVDTYSLRITSAGRLAYEEAQEAREQDAKQKRQQRFDNKISIANLLVPAVTFFLGLLVEHFGGILGFILSLFQ